MLPIIDTIECQRDSPLFRQVIDLNEKNLENLEIKLEKIIKQCSQMVSAGRSFNHEQEQLVHSMWELSSYFSDDSVVQGGLNCLLDALRETANYHKILIDQAARAIVKNFNTVIKDDMKSVKEKKHWFEKASLEMDSVLNRSSTVSKANDSEELNKQVWATRQAFRHTAIDYMYSISMVQSKKRHEVVDAILSYTKAYNTFYHQGSDLTNDLKPSLDKIAKNVHDMRNETFDLSKLLENRHLDITGKDLILTNTNRNSQYPICMQGYLYKRTNNAFKSWNRRYFTLQNNQLVYRKRSGEEVTIMEDDLRLCSVRQASDVERRFCFEVISNIKSHVLQAESEDSCQEWMEALMKAISSALQQNCFALSLNKGSYETSLIQYPASYSNLSPSNSPSTRKHISASGESNKNRLFESILKIPGNCICCDCESPDPKWASINLGITLCIECSGIHRSLGVHYSKVRSLTLDKWDLEVIRVMEKLGNEVINKIYVSNYQQLDFSICCEIDSANNVTPQVTPAFPNCSRSIRESWIRAKYIEKRFVLPCTEVTAFFNLLNQVKLFSGHNVTKLNFSSMPSSDKCEFLVKGLSDVDGNTLTNAPLIVISDIDLDIGIEKVTAQSSIAGSHVNLACSTHVSPLEILFKSSEAAHIPLMCLSLALGADKNCHNEDGKTPLHLAVTSKSTLAVEFLLLNGAKVNALDIDGRAPLHLASMESNILQVYRLIKYRADWKIRDANQKTATEYAVESNEPDLVTLLRVATLSEQLDKEDVDEEMTTIMQELYWKKSPLLSSEDLE